jgi:hypothetical protein
MGLCGGVGAHTLLVLLWWYCWYCCGGTAGTVVVVLLGHVRVLFVQAYAALALEQTSSWARVVAGCSRRGLFSVQQGATLFHCTHLAVMEVLHEQSCLEATL